MNVSNGTAVAAPLFLSLFPFSVFCFGNECRERDGNREMEKIERVAAVVVVRYDEGQNMALNDCQE